MNVNLFRAADIFYPTSSLEMVYFEAIANAIDAGASKIDIQINIASPSDPKSLSLKITDNGTGFTNGNFEKFSSLLEADNNNHKGLGRLVFLKYFGKIEFESIYESNKKRVFELTFDFNGNNNISNIDDIAENGTILTLLIT